MWKPIELEEGRSYCLALCQDQQNKRYCCITEAGAEAPHELRRTTVIPNDLLRARASRQISESYLLTTGQSFVFGPHGEWFTQEEIEAINKEDFLSVPWVSGAAPELPAR